MVLSSSEDLIRGEFSAVVGNDYLGLATRIDERCELPGASHLQDIAQMSDSLSLRRANTTGCWSALLRFRT
jgi:hypothetical protein